MHIYYKQIPNKVIFLYKIKEHPIQTLYKLFKEDLKIYFNPTTISPPANMIQPVVPPPQNIQIQQDTFINTSA